MWASSPCTCHAAKAEFIRRSAGRAPIPGETISLAGAFQRITEEMGVLKEKKAFLLTRQEGNSATNRRIRDAVDILNWGDPRFTEWNESDIRQLVDTVVVLSADRLRVCLRDGMEIEQTIEEGQET